MPGLWFDARRAGVEGGRGTCIWADCEGGPSPVLCPPMRRRPLCARAFASSAAGGVPTLGMELGGGAGKLSQWASFPAAPRYPPGQTGSWLTHFTPVWPCGRLPCERLSYTPSIQWGGSCLCPTPPRRHGGAGVAQASYTPWVEGPGKPLPGDERFEISQLLLCAQWGLQFWACARCAPWPAVLAIHPALAWPPLRAVVRQRP